MTKKKCKKGFRVKGSKCVRVKKSSSQVSKKLFNKKTKNPFKLWGSYVGAVMGWLLAKILLSGDSARAVTSFLDFGGLEEFTFGLHKFVIFLGGGFLIGWGVHAWILMRKK